MAQADYFLKIDGVQGESKDDKHPNELQIQSWSFGATNSGSSSLGSGAGTGKVSYQDFHFTIDIGKSGPKLLEHCSVGTHIKNAILTCRKAGGAQEEYLKVNFEDVLISSYQIGGSGGQILPSEQISFNFSRINVDYKEQKADGTLGGTTAFKYDIKANKKL